MKSKQSLRDGCVVKWLVEKEWCFNYKVGLQYWQGYTDWETIYLLLRCLDLLPKELTLFISHSGFNITFSRFVDMQLSTKNSCWVRKGNLIYDRYADYAYECNLHLPYKQETLRVCNRFFDLEIRDAKLNKKREKLRRDKRHLVACFRFLHLACLCFLLLCIYRVFYGKALKEVCRALDLSIEFHGLCDATEARLVVTLVMQMTWFPFPVFLIAAFLYVARRVITISLIQQLTRSKKWLHSFIK